MELAAIFSGIPHNSRNRLLYDRTWPSGLTTRTPSSVASCCALRIAIVVRRDEILPSRAERSHRAIARFASASLDGFGADSS